VLALRLAPDARRALAKRGQLGLRLRVSLAGAKPVVRRVRLRSAPLRADRSHAAQLTITRGL